VLEKVRARDRVPAELPFRDELSDNRRGKLKDFRRLSRKCRGYAARSIGPLGHLS
jgi:hypothetical protein